VQLQAASSMPDVHLLITPSTRTKHNTTAGTNSATLKRKQQQQQHAKDSISGNGTVTTTPDSKTQSSNDAAGSNPTEQHIATADGNVTDADNAKREELYNVGF
jgi:hypothetical protein